MPPLGYRSLVIGAAWGKFRKPSLTGKSMPLGRALGFHSLQGPLILSVCFTLVFEDGDQLPVPTMLILTVTPLHHDGLSSFWNEVL